MASRGIPNEFVTPLRKGDFDQLFEVAQDLTAQRPDDALIGLWRIAVSSESVEPKRILSYWLVRVVEGPLAEATRIWLMANSGQDPTTLVNTLSGLSVHAIERAGVPDYEFPLLANLLIAALRHSEVSVRVSAFDFIRDYCVSVGVPRKLGRASAREIAEVLETQLSDIVEDEEVAELQEALKALRSEKVPESSSISIDGLDDLVDYLAGSGELDDISTVVKRYRLFQSARRLAKTLNRPVLTVRVESRNSTAFLDRVQELVDLCRMQHSALPEEWIEAPAASTSMHLKASAETSESAMDRLRRAVELTEGQADAGTAVLALPPRQAAAVTAMMREGVRDDVNADFVFSVPNDERQTVLRFEGGRLESDRRWHTVRDQAERRASAEPEVYSEEVPQANTVAQVFEAVDALLSKGEVEISDVSNISSIRQLNYYKQGARILGFLDTHNHPTELARELRNKGETARLQIAARAFNDSMVGIAWRTWAGVVHLRDIDSGTATDFLADRAVGISGSTIPRRAQTLRKWHVELLPYY